jgi:hypothetical protein
MISISAYLIEQAPKPARATNWEEASPEGQQTWLVETRPTRVASCRLRFYTDDYLIYLRAPLRVAEETTSPLWSAISTSHSISPSIKV